VIARNTCPILCHKLHVEVVFGHKYCKNDCMNMKFKSKLLIAIENVLQFFQFFQINSVGKIEFRIHVTHMVLVLFSTIEYLS